RTLLSFPTRRSSDLACSPFIFFACRKGYELRRHWAVFLMLHLLAGIAASLLQIGVCSVGAVVEARELNTGFTWGYLYKVILITQDRKSTRLNSSHVA